MKSYEDIAERVFQKGDEILRRKQKRIALIKKNTLIISEICAAVIVCVGVWKTDTMKIFMSNNFPDSIVSESENSTEHTDLPISVSTSEYKENETYSSETVAAVETEAETERNTSALSTEPSAENTAQGTYVRNNNETAQTQTVLQTIAQTDLQTAAQTNLQTTPITTENHPHETVCTTEQTDERSYYMKQLASFFTSAIVIASSAAPMLGNAEYQIDESRYWPGEKAIFDKMDSGELDLDINGDGVFDLFDGYTLQRYLDHKIDPDYEFPNTEMKERYYSDLYQVVDQETIDRIEAIADYNGDGKVNDIDTDHLVRYFIVNRNLKREHLEPSYFCAQSPCESHETHANWTSEELYVNSLIDNMEFLLAGYDIVAEMYENGTLDLDFNGNGQLDIGDVYTFYVYTNGASFLETIKTSDFITADEIARCKEEYAKFPTTSFGSSLDKFLQYVTAYIVGHIELKPEYFTEEYYKETFKPYCRPRGYIINYRVKDAAAKLGLKPDENAWLKFIEDDFYDFFDAYCNDVESGRRPAPDVNLDGVVDYYDYFASNIYMTDLINSKTADESILPADVWNNLAENCDLNGNGTTKDIIDILTVQLYVVKYVGNNDNFDQAYKDYTESLGGTSTYTTEAVSYENNLRILSEFENNEVVYGDANCDGEVTIADATAILQALGNPDKYGLSKQGAKNADCCDPGDGVTTNDAIAIQKKHAKVLSELPEIIK
ncbi:MAG: hypothetical protein J6B75_03315 [Ruminococcus sp.]|nr:hypothetical protein [Ruminococcus sp.]